MNTLDRALYRGKRVDTGEWVEGGLIHTKHRTAILLPCEKSLLVDPETLGQWLGTTDNKGVDAYEGDIAEHHVDYSPQSYSSYGGDDEPVSEWFTGVVGYQPSRGAVLKVKKMRDDFGSGDDIKHREVKNFYNSRATIIGNIHDNPELIEVSK